MLVVWLCVHNAEIPQPKTPEFSFLDVSVFKVSGNLSKKQH